MQHIPSEVAEVYYRILNITGFGPARTNGLVRTLISMYNLPTPITKQGLEKELFRHLNSQQIAAYQHHTLPELENLKAAFPFHYLTRLDKLYPNYMICNTSNPSVFCYMGNIKLLEQKRVGYSGARNCSKRGLKFTADSVEQLVKNKICIVSGYANGVDEMAHYTALKTGGTTIMVLPYGITFFTIKPMLEEVWDWERVLVISEFLPTNPFTTPNAFQRNETIIRMSQAVIVSEAGITGGSIATGMRSLALKYPTFTPQYKEYPLTALGNKEILLKGGNPLPVQQPPTDTMQIVLNAIKGMGSLF